MTHFAVLVALKPIQDASPALIQDAVDRVMAPFHEFECTGKNDQYVQNIDITDQVKAEYAQDTTWVVADPDGKYHQPHDSQFYREPTPEEQVILDDPSYGGVAGKPYPFECTTHDWSGSGRVIRIHEIPAGWEKKKVLTSELQTLKAYCAEEGHYIIDELEEPDLDDGDGGMYGWARFDTEGNLLECIKRTNPNKKWDWYQIGGRFVLEALSTKDNYFYETESVIKGQWDISEHRQREAVAAGKEYDHMLDLLGVTEEDMVNFKSWARLVDEEEANAKAEKRCWKRDNVESQYNSQRVRYVVRAIATNDDIDHEEKKNLFDIDRFSGLTREAYMEKKRLSTGMGYAAIREDGPWLERGTVGWFGSSTEENPCWEKTFSDWLDNVPEDWMLVVVDCHI